MRLTWSLVLFIRLYLDTCYNEIGQCAQLTDTIFSFNCGHNWEDACDHIEEQALIIFKGSLI